MCTQENKSMNETNNQPWLIKYEELMFGDHPSEVSIAEAEEMKYDHMPQLLFKYRSCTPETFEALENNFLYSSQPKLFKDPFEGPISIVIQDAMGKIIEKTYSSMRHEYPFLQDKPTVSSAAIIENIKSSFDSLYNDFDQNRIPTSLAKKLADYLDDFLNNEIEKILENARNMYNVCCFCAVNDGVTMWEHYADNHQGFCIGYGIKELNSAITDCTFPVIYKSDCHLFIHNVEDINGFNCMNMLTIKTTDWSVEKEWRTLFPQNPPIHKEQMPTAKAVYLGSKIDIIQEEQLRDICMRKGILLYKIRPNYQQHKLEALPYPY
jgi:hypothetical protein